MTFGLQAKLDFMLAFQQVQQLVIFAQSHLKLTLGV
jgi:hypothetical protein